MDITFEIEGIPELAKRLDEIAVAVAGPIAREALQSGGEVIRAQAEANVHKKTGALAEDIVVVTRVFEQHKNSYVLIGPGWGLALEEQHHPEYEYQRRRGLLQQYDHSLIVR